MYREEAGLSAADAASLAGVHRNTIYDLEKDDDGVTMRVMKKVAAVYGKSLGEIFHDEKTPERVPVEFRPLLEPLRVLDFPARVALIRNMAANLNFMAAQFSSAAATSLLNVEVAEGRNHREYASSQSYEDASGAVRGAVDLSSLGEEEDAPETPSNRTGSASRKGRAR
jgi:DNA-binding XRE family transcriptional regulator